MTFQDMVPTRMRWRFCSEFSAAAPLLISCLLPQKAATRKTRCALYFNHIMKSWNYWSVCFIDNLLWFVCLQFSIIYDYFQDMFGNESDGTSEEEKLRESLLENKKYWVAELPKWLLHYSDVLFIKFHSWLINILIMNYRCRIPSRSSKTN
jgi:hypothetical protein